MASGGVEVEIPADSVKRVGEVKARLSGQGSAKLRLSLSGNWVNVDWRRRPKAAYETLKVAMQPVLVCVEYPDESYEVGATISLPLYVSTIFQRR